MDINKSINTKTDTINENTKCDTNKKNKTDAKNTSDTENSMEFMSIELKDLILETIKEVVPKSQRPYTFSDEYILENVCDLLKNLTKWRAIQRTQKNEKVNHYSTIFKRYRKWVDYDVFKIAYNKLLNKYIFPEINTKKTLELFIDGTLVNNKHGIDFIGHGENAKKNNTKITVICDFNKKNVYSVDFFKGNTSDVNTVEPLVESLIDKINTRKINLVGDKGYILGNEKNDKLKKINVNMHVPKRKNQKGKTGAITKKHLRKRYIVEHCIQQVKTFDRIYTRKDSKLCNYKGFFYLALILKFKK